ncbi:MAG: hypothetical protein ACYCYK_04635 [Candidatus Dormibacteria bacterium]
MRLGQEWRSRGWLGPAVICLAMAGLYLWFVHAYGVNVPFEDEWHMVTLLASVHHGRLSLNMLWAQHNENRMLFAYLVLLVLELASHFNTTIEMYASAALLLAAVVLIWRLHRTTAGGWSWGLVPAALVLLSLAQFTISLQGFAVAIYMVIASFALAMWLLEGSSDRPWLLGLAVLVAVIGSYSSIQGLAIWPAGMAYLVLRHPSRRQILLWTGAGLATSGLYLVGFNWALTGGGGLGAALSQPTTSLHYLALLVGSAVPQSTLLHLDLTTLSALGIVILAMAAAIYLLAYRLRPAAELAVAIAMVTLGLVVDVLNTLGRAGQGVSYAASGRYVVFNLWLLAGVWLGALAAWRRLRQESAIPTLGLCCAVVLVGLQIGLSLHSGLIAGRDLHKQREAAARLVAHYANSQPALVRKDVYPSYSVFLERAMILRHLRLSVFARVS